MLFTLLVLVGRFVRAVGLITTDTGCPLVLESHGILKDNFPGLESRGKQQRSWKVLKNDDNVVEFLQPQ